MSATEYIGAGATLSSNYYIRSFYAANRSARTSSGRSDMRSSELSYADSVAMRRAIRDLGKADYIEDKDSNIRNSVEAFINVYNNLLDSASKSEDYTLERNAKQLKSLTKEYSDQLDKIGITVKGNGSLEIRDSLFKSASLSKFEKLFSKDSDYMQRSTACAKRMERQSQTLENTALNKLSSGAAKKSSNVPGSDGAGNTEEGTEAAKLAADALGLNAMVNAGIGQNINVVL